jgi:hypothetical protein
VGVGGTGRIRVPPARPERSGARSWNYRLSSIGQDERLSGPRRVRGQRGAGRVRLGASCGGHDQAHQADTCPRPCAGPSGHLARGSQNASRARPKASGWFDNRTQKITPERSDSPDPQWGSSGRELLDRAEDLSQLSHRLTGRHRTQAHSQDIRRILTCGFGFWRTGWADGIGLRIRRLGVRVPPSAPRPVGQQSTVSRHFAEAPTLLRGHPQ